MPEKETPMRWCEHCNRQFGEQEKPEIVCGKEVHSLCAADYRREVSDKMAALSMRRLYLPSLGDKRGFG